MHTDDPRDAYVEGDIIIRSERDVNAGRGHYNLYNNKLLKSIPDGEGWYHFIDDDDEYYDEFSIENLVKNAKRDHINVCRVKRWNETIFPAKWGNQRSFQTECFFLHTDHKLKATWWNKTGGDHHYSKQLTAILPINWIENLIGCKAQQGKGRGLRFDYDQTSELEEYMRNVKISTCGKRYENEKLVKVVYKRRVSGRSVMRGRIGETREIPGRYAQILYNLGKVDIVE